MLDITIYPLFNKITLTKQLELFCTFYKKRWQEYDCIHLFSVIILSTSYIRLSMEKKTQNAKQH